MIKGKENIYIYVCLRGNEQRSHYTAIAKRCAVTAYPVPPFKDIHEYIIESDDFLKKRTTLERRNK